MKRKMILIGFVGLVGLLVGVFIVQTNQLDKALEEQPVNQVFLSEISDGTYHGLYESSLVSAEVDVTVVNQQITEIIITRHDTLFGKDAEVVIDDVLLEQSLDVDDVAGATYSSKVIKRAIENALQS